MGLFDKIKQGLAKTTKTIGGVFASFTGVNDEFYEELEERLILADVGVETATEAVERLRAAAKSENLRGADDLRDALADILAEYMPRDAGLELSTKPAVILVIGVNGVGKTTTIGKLAARFRGEGKRVVLVAGDTFRAAAGEQLSIWAERADAEIILHGEGADPAAVVFDGINAAKARGADVVICDTAGRLHNKSNLMNELNKISRVIDRELPGASRETLLVLDATTGQNGLVQAEKFREAAGITGVVLTKLDGTAKGGVTVAIASRLGIPVKLIGVGEGVDDLVDFDAKIFTRALLGD